MACGLGPSPREKHFRLPCSRSAATGLSPVGAQSTDSPSIRPRCQAPSGQVAVDEIPHPIEQLAMAKPSGCPPRPSSQAGTGSSDRIASHSASLMSGRIPANPFGMISRASETVSDTTTRWKSRVELHRRERAQLRQLGLLERGWLRNPELPRGPAFMSSPPEHRPTQIPLRVASHHDRQDNRYLGGALWQAEMK